MRVAKLVFAALAALYVKTISKVRCRCLCRFVVKSIQCQSRLQSEFLALPLLWDLRGNSARSQPRTVLRVVNGFGVSKFDVKPLPWVPEPQNLNERKLVRGKERRKKGGSGQMITQPRFGADQRDYESIRSPFAL